MDGIFGLFSYFSNQAEFAERDAQTFFQRGKKPDDPDGQAKMKLAAIFRQMAQMIEQYEQKVFGLRKQGLQGWLQA